MKAKSGPLEIARMKGRGQRRNLMLVPADKAVTWTYLNTITSRNYTPPFFPKKRRLQYLLSISLHTTYVTLKWLRWRLQCQTGIKQRKETSGVTMDPELQPLTLLVKLFHRLCGRNNQPPSETDQRVSLCNIHPQAELRIWKDCVGFTTRAQELVIFLSSSLATIFN